MGGRVVKSVNNPAGGERRVLTGSAPLASSRPLVAVAADALLESWENGGATRHGIRGDGRLVLPKLPAPPLNPTDGDFWLEDDGFGGVELHYQDGASNTIIGGGSGGGGGGGINFSLIPDSVNIFRGYAVRCRLELGQPRVGLATAGTGSVAGGLYDVAALLAEDVPNPPDPPTDAIRLILPGQTIELTAGQLTGITGAPALVPSRRYFLSPTSGRWILQPLPVPNLEVVVPVGYALTETVFLFQPGMAIVL
jgi:hypothetical protein